MGHLGIGREQRLSFMNEIVFLFTLLPAQNAHDEEKEEGSPQISNPATKYKQRPQVSDFPLRAIATWP